MATKQLNKRLVVGLSIFGFGLMLLVAVLMLRQLQRRDPVYFVGLAEASAAQEQWGQAGLFYHEAWKHGENPAHLVEFGEMLLRDGEVSKALSVWREALIHQPDLLDAHERQLMLLLQVAHLYGTPQRWQQVRENAEVMLGIAAPRTPQQEAFAHHAQGLALLSLESQDPTNTERGLAELAQATSLDPDRVEYAVDMAVEWARLDRAEDAERLLRELTERHGQPGPDAARARMSLARHLAARQRFDEAEPLFHESVTLATGDPAALGEARLAHAWFLAQRWARAVRDPATKDSAQAHFDQAEAILKNCIDADPMVFEPYLQIALLYKLALRHADVVEVCEARIRRGLSRKGAKATQNRVHMFSLMIYASEACVALAVRSSESGDLAEKEKWLARAEQYVADAKGESPTHPRVLSQSGRVKLARAQDREALKDLRAADEAYGSYEAVSWENKILLAQVHLRLGEAGAAREVLEAVMEQATKFRGKDPIFWNLYAQVLFQVGALDRALAVSDRVLLMDRSNRDATQLKAAVYERQGKHAEAGRVHEELTGSGAVRAMLQARAAALNGDSEQAIKILRQALERDPTDVRLVGTTVHELINGNRYHEAGEIVAEALQRQPDDLRLQQLALLTREDLSADARDRATQELILAEEDGFQRSLDLIAFHSRRNEPAEAIRALDAAEAHLLAKDAPMARSATSEQHAALLKAKVRAAVQANDDAAMQAARDAAAKYNVDGAGGKSILGWYHFQRREFDLALNAYREVVQIQPTDATSLAHLGQCLQLAGRTDEAQSAYEEAVRINPNQATAHQGLALLAQSRGDQELFRRELAHCERLIPNDPWVQEQVVIRLEDADPPGAIRRREARRAAAPDDAKNLQRLAALYDVVADRLKADECYARLLDMQPHELSTVAAAAAHFRKTDRPQRALELVMEHAGSRSDLQERALAQRLVANEFIQQRRLEDAERTLLAADIELKTAETAQSVAEFYLRAAQQPEKAAPWFRQGVDRAQAARSPKLPSFLEAAIGCLLNRAVGDLENARQLVELLRTAHPEYARGLLWKSEIHARDGEIDRAIAALTDYLDKQPNDAYALYQRARHQLSRGRTAAAVDDLEAIKRVAPLALDLQPRMLLASLRKQGGRKEDWLAELESTVKDAPGRAGPVESLAQAYIQEKRLVDADRLVTAQINRTTAAPDPRWFFLRGQVSLELQEPDKALQDYRQGAELSAFTPAAILGVLNVYLGTGRFAAGVEYLERYGTTATTNAAVVSRYAQLLARSASPAKAVEQFRKAMALALAESATTVRTVAEDVVAAFSAADAISAFTAEIGDPATRRANERILIRLHTAAKRVDEALARLEALYVTAADDRERAALLHEKGDILQTAARSPQAIDAYREALRHDAENWITLNNVAYLLSDIRGENAAALPFAQQAVRQADNAFTLDTLGWIYVGLGRYSFAVAELSRAIRLDPNYLLPYYHLGEAYRRNSQFTEAADILAQALALARGAGDESTLRLVETAQQKTNDRQAAP